MFGRLVQLSPIMIPLNLFHQSRLKYNEADWTRWYRNYKNKMPRCIHTCLIARKCQTTLRKDDIGWSRKWKRWSWKFSIIYHTHLILPPLNSFSSRIWITFFIKKNSDDAEKQDFQHFIDSRFPGLYSSRLD